MHGRRACRGCGRGLGFTYVGLLFAVAIAGAALAGAGTLWSTAMQRERERELLFIGNEFRVAIGRYLESSPGARQYPRTLEDLLRDPRYPNVRRYLRKIYADPFTGKAEWGFIRRGDFIAGIYSLANGRPLKIGNFDGNDRAFADAKTYAGWKFVYPPETVDETFGTSNPVATAPPPFQDGVVIVGEAPPPTAPPIAPTPPNPKPSPCIDIRAGDMATCQQIAAAQGQAAAWKCNLSIAERYGACLRGRTNLPPLVTN